jgi:hypothetical protein
MQNSMGGFLGRGTKIRGGVYTMAPWEWKRVDSTGDDLRKNMVPFPERQPSAVMFNLLSLLINYTDRVSGATDTMVGENPGQNTPAETSRNTTEQGMQVYSVIFKRVWRSMKEEFKKLHQLNAVFLKTSQPFGANGEVIRREDYSSNPDHVVPVADPHVTSDSQRVQQAIMLKQAAMTSPGYNKDKVERNFLRALKIDGADEFYKDGVQAGPPEKVQVEQLKQKSKADALGVKAKSMAIQLSETRRMNTAKIGQMQAQTIKLMHDAKIDRQDVRLRAADIAIKALQEHNAMITELIKELGAIDGTETSGAGGVPSLEGTPSDDGMVPDDGGMAGVPEEPMGMGELPEGESPGNGDGQRGSFGGGEPPPTAV